MKLKHFIPFGTPAIGKEEIDAVVETLQSGWIGMGPKTVEFEEKFKEYTGAKFAISVSSCTAGLHLSLLALNIGPGDEVITTPLTFVSTVNVIVESGATPVFVDVDLDTFNIDPKKIAQKISKKTKAILPVHFGGLACDMEAINTLAKKHNLVVIEDAAHALGTMYEGKLIGSGNNLANFSFYANKNVTTIEGGMITTANKLLADRLSAMRMHGLSNDAWSRYHARGFKKTSMTGFGYKYNLTDVQSVMGIEQLKKFARMQKTRERYAQIYDKYFKDLDIVKRQSRPPLSDRKNKHALHLYALVITDPKIKRDELLIKLREANIGAAIHYGSVHLEPYYQNKFGFKKGMFPVAEKISANIFSLPLSPSIKEEDVRKIGKITRKLLESM